MGVDLTLAALRLQLDRLGGGAILKVSEHDCERLFGINEIGAASVAQFASRHHCVSIQGADAVYFRKWDVVAHGPIELVQDDCTIPR
ncbi:MULTISPECIES: hypothetical protein [unclassified Bradyrhizobium]|jgi:hypothetical protein|uniref:hypothetical protein n=1 Tax=unclassified Bradyrhizobium TaxID=2631580 RepID=UPI000464D8D2|nr:MULTISPECIES: hypothetical protein [unclassified Bradyrhizobium]